MTATHHVAVIGLGAIGAAALYQLARRGVPALGIDRYDPPHGLGSSHGETRITRQAVGEGAAFVPLVRRSQAIWGELQASTGAALFTACGMLLIGSLGQSSSHHGRPDFVAATERVARQFSVPHEMLDHTAIARRFPQFTNLPADAAGYYEPGAGFLRPEACVAAQLAAAAQLGASIMRNTRVGAITPRRGGLRLTTTAGAIDAERAIVAAGAWTAPLLGPPFDRLLRVTRQVLHWFEPAAPAVFAPGRCPVFIDMWGPGDSDYFYGFPIPPGEVGVKLATEQYEVTTDAETADRAVSASEAADMYATHVAGRLAGVRPRILRSAACLYTNTPDANFLIDSHPAMPGVLVVSACSGHGFKHSAAIGEAVAELVTTGRSAIDLAPFRIGGQNT
jgi:sarcosine oxidase